MASKNKVQIIIEAIDKATSIIGSIDGAFVKLGKIGLGAAATGIGLIGTGLGVAAKTGLGFNQTMEMVTAQLNAFTKDAEVSAEILEMIKDRAAKTPFEFEQMATAASSLLPAAKASGEELETLIQTAEILAASNPAQGLEGAAFSLREALSGDFVSIIDRFNLPRQRINELKEQGVPALEAISTAMAEMGLDASLVANLSETASGRMSTLKDILTGLAGTATQPIFDFLSDSLGNLLETLEPSVPMAQDFIEALIGGDKTTAIANLQGILMNFGFSPEQIAGISESASNIIDSFSNISESMGTISWSDVASGVETAVAIFEKLALAVKKTNDAIQIGLGLYDQMTTIWEKNPALGANLTSAANIVNPLAGAGGAFAGVQAQGGWGQLWENTKQISPSELGKKLLNNITGRIQIHPQTVQVQIDGKAVGEAVASYLVDQSRGNNAVPFSGGL